MANNLSRIFLYLSFSKSPFFPLFQRGRWFSPLWKRGVRGDFYLYHCFFQRRFGFFTASASSSRLTTVVCGAFFTISGLVSASFAIAIIASQNESMVSFGSVSVGSIIMASSTMRGKFTVGGWNP